MRFGRLIRTLLPFFFMVLGAWLLGACPGGDADDDASSPPPTDSPEPLTDRDEDGYTTDDCDDDDPAVNPGASEVCDGLDNDCDGLIDADDPDLADGTSWYLDQDGDGHGASDPAIVACEPPEGYAATGDDCDDTRADVYPGAEETDCTDPTDYNCDGSTLYQDQDEDGAPACEDCNDGDPDVSPEAAEVCDGVDNDCDGLTDDEDSSLTGAPSWYPDMDGDGFGDPAGPTSACQAPDHHVADGTDCDDTNPDINPDTTWYIDEDGDGFGSDSSTRTQCEQPDGYAPNADDCDDSDSRFNPESDLETCTDPNDYNCDGAVGYADQDGDGHPACEECDDSDAATYPGADETCDGRDNDCDGEIDEDVETTWYLDADGDGYGDERNSLQRCEAPSPIYLTTAGDCDDLDPSVNPDALETCDGRDNDCDGLVDDEDSSVTGATTWYQDSDQDGFGTDSSTVVQCARPEGYTAEGGDCDDARADIHPGAGESCDGVDNDCDDLIDDQDPDVSDPATWYLDQDGDGFGQTASSLVQCTQPDGYVTDAGDCDDSNAAIAPEAIEICDSLDNDCDGLTDDQDPEVEGRPTWYLDNDEDGYGTSRIFLVQCAQPDWYVDNDQDCDDMAADIHPGADEWCNGLDDDCDGETDEDALDASTWYRDEDGDGFGVPDETTAACARPEGFVANAEDCDDSRADISPGAEEACDGLDNDCDGEVDNGIPGSDATCAGEDCLSILDEVPDAPSGLYWIRPQGADAPYQVYCDMTTDGGGWTLVLQASSTSAYVYDHPVWTDTEPSSVQTPDPSLDQDAVSPAFYHLTGKDSMLCMKDLDHCAGWRHEEDTARNLVNGPRQGTAYEAARDCTTFHCGPNSYPASLRAVTAGSDAWTYHRFGYINDVNDWGSSVRVGFSGDGDTSDSSDTIIGIGLSCTGSCASNSQTNGAHGQGAGYYAYHGWATPPLDAPLQGFLFIRGRTGEYCGDGIDNDGDGEVDEGDIGTDPDCPAPDCYAIKQSDPGAGDGLYWLDPDAAGAPFQTYCDMTTDGGGWTLVMQAASESALTYDHVAWTAYSHQGPTAIPDPALDQDAVSHAFYTIQAVESRLCLMDLDHCAAWNHGEGTPRDLANGPRATAIEEVAEPCSSFKCGPHTLPLALEETTSGSYSDTYYRFGYVNDVNGWGTRTRVGFTGDGDSSDSSDSIIGMGLSCTSSCASYSTTDGPHGYGSGFYLYHGWAEQPYDGSLPGFLFVRPRWSPDHYAGEICGDGVDNDGDGEVDEDPSGETPGCPATDCLSIITERPDAPDGLYWIDFDGTGRPIQTWCDMTRDGGGWTLVLQASNYSAYTYSHAVWTASEADSSEILTTDPGVSQDAVSPGFYRLQPSQSMLCMGDLDHCAAWNHEPDTPVDLANGPRLAGSQYAAEVCYGFFCGPNTLPAAIRDATSGTTSGAWHRWGYVNDVNSWGTSTRVGFTGDNDSSDSSDTVIGLGLACYANCTSNSTTGGAHGGGSGFYEYHGWSTAPHDGPLDGFLLVR